MQSKQLAIGFFERRCQARVCGAGPHLLRGVLGALARFRDTEQCGIDEGELVFRHGDAMLPTAPDGDCRE